MSIIIILIGMLTIIFVIAKGFNSNINQLQNIENKLSKLNCTVENIYKVK